MPELYRYLHDAIITLPDLCQLPISELETLVHAFQKELIRSPEYYHLFGFSAIELQQFDTHRPQSFAQARRRVSLLTKQRMAQSPLFQEAVTNVGNSRPYDDILLEAARLGKYALKNRKLMSALWEKLHSQVRIAELLGVDRSSVHRRLKEYGIMLQSVE